MRGKDLAQKARAEPFALWRSDRWPVALSPFYMNPAFRFAFDGPVHFKHARQVRKRTVLGSVRRKLMESQTNKNCQSHGKTNIRPIEFYALAGAIVVRLKQVAPLPAMTDSICGPMMSQISVQQS